MTIRQQILLNIRTLFAGINGQPPYQSSVDSVSDYDIGAFEKITDDVMIGVYATAYQLPRGLTRVTHAQDVKACLTVGVRGIIRAGTSDVASIKDNLVDDIGRALYANINLGILTGNAVYHDGINITQESIQPYASAALASFLGTMQVYFLLDPSNP